MDEELRIIISGGGTGGHIFPAVSIANAIKAKHPDAKILFVGALGRMEMQRVPAAGYEIKGLPIQGFDRKNLLKNVKVLFKIWKSQRMARQIIKDFRPMAAVGVGGYASGPTLNKAAAMGIPCLIQEQNSYAGVTNKLLAKKADKICVAYEGMERFFPAEKIIMTGNPVRQALLENKMTKAEAIQSFGLDPQKKAILIVGGSLGAGTVNKSVMQHLDDIEKSGVQVIWQTGKYYHADIIKELEGRVLTNVKIILVPSPNVAEDHQTKNAMALVNKQAALYVKDAEAPEKVISMALETVQDEQALRSLSENILKLALPNSADIIADEVIKLTGYSGKSNA